MRVFAIGHTELRVHPLLLVVVAAACVLGRLNALLQSFLAILIHEGAHALLARAFGCRVHALELMPFGAVARIGRRGLSPKTEFCIAAAGPVVSLLTAGLTAMCGQLFQQPVNRIVTFMAFNLVLAAVNLLPALPLDGGRILRAALSKRLSYARATKLCAAAGLLFGAGFLALTVYCATHGIYNLICPVMGVFLCLAAGKEIRMLPEAGVEAYLHRHDGLERGESCRVQLIAVHESMRAQEAAQLLQRESFSILRVVSAQMRFLGELEEGDVLRGIAQRGADVSVGELLGCSASGS